MPTCALKEWAVAVDALTAGETILLLRKGGIRESRRKFEVRNRQVWLYPTYEHQKPQLLKPQYAKKVKEVKSGWHPETIAIKGYAEITQILEISDRNIISTLEPYYIWQESAIGERFKWKPQQPLLALLLRVYRTTTSQIIPYHPSYGGCKSWIDLVETITTEELTPALDDKAYQKRVNHIISSLNT